MRNATTRLIAGLALLVRVCAVPGALFGGAALVVAGLAWIHPAAGLIGAGLLLVAGAVAYTLAGEGGGG